MKKYQTAYIWLLVLLPAAMGTMAQEKAGNKSPLPKPKPNIIWIITEDMSPELGCYGNPLVKTPNVDALAKQGVRYTNTFVTGPVCSASRSALITSMYQTGIDAQNHRSHRDDGYTLPSPVKPMTEYFRQAGYYTVNGELGPNGIKCPGQTDYNFELKNKPFDASDWKDRKPDQPFFAQIMISCTYRRPIWKNAVQQHQPQIDPDKVTLPPYYPNDPVAREDWATYLESIQLMDFYVGNLMKRITGEGLADNTVVKPTPAQALFCAPVKPAEELYDLKADPYELSNLALSAKHYKTLMQMRSIPQNWIRETGEKGQFAEKKIWLPKKVAEG